MKSDSERRRIAKLLRIRVEYGFTPAEAASALRHANRLMERCGLVAEDFNKPRARPKPAPFWPWGPGHSRKD